MFAFGHFKKTAVTALAAAGLSIGLAPLANAATLLGDTITVTTTANIPVDTWSDTFVVVVGAELVGGGASNHANTNQGQIFADLFPGDFIDVGASSVTFIYAALGEAFGFPYAFSTDFTGLDFSGPASTLQSVSVAAGAVGLSAFNISMITPNSFRFQATVDLVGGANFTLDLTTVETPIAVIPLPAAFPLFATALAGMGLMGWRRKRKTV